MDGQPRSEGGNSTAFTTINLGMTPDGVLRYKPNGLITIGRSPHYSETSLTNDRRDVVLGEHNAERLGRLHLVVRESNDPNGIEPPLYEAAGVNPSTVYIPEYQTIRNENVFATRVNLVPIELGVDVPAMEVPRVSIVRLPLRDKKSILDRFKKERPIEYEYTYMAVVRDSNAFRFVKFQSLKNIPHDVLRVMQAQPTQRFDRMQVGIAEAADPSSFIASKQRGRLYERSGQFDIGTPPYTVELDSRDYVRTSGLNNERFKEIKTYQFKNY